MTERRFFLRRDGINAAAVLCMLFSAAQDRFTGWCRHALRCIVPVECVTCGVGLTSDPVPFFCRPCWVGIIPLQKPSCARCDQPFVSSAAGSFTPAPYCQRCLERAPAYQRAWTLYPYLPPLQNAICSFKYRGKIGLAKPLASLMIRALPPAIDADVIVPVPLHRTRLQAREFNQSLLLADRIGRHMSLPVSATDFVRTLPTEPQTTLSRPERLRNLRQAFAVINSDAVVGRRILLIDDVYTTGTTLNECAKVLLQAGADSVCGLTLARTVDASLVPDRLFAERSERSLSALGM